MPGRKTLYLHIGHYKTGTSALQLFLARNRKALVRQGLDYLRYGCFMSKHSRFAFSLLKEAGVDRLMHRYNNPNSAEVLWRELLAAVRASKAQTCLISTEEFMRIGAYEEACAGLAQVAAGRGDDIDIRVIVYLRAPDDHLRSWYNQLVKMQIPVPDFTAAVTEVMEPVHYDYGLALRPWIEVFGPEAVIVRPYDPATRHGTGLYEDFLGVFGIDFDAGHFRLPDADPNPRLDDRILPLVRMMQNAGLPDAAVNRAKARAAAYLAQEYAHSQGWDQGFEQVVSRARAGLSTLEGLPQSAIDTAAMRACLPMAEDDQSRQTQLLLGFVFAELKAQRRTAAHNNAQLAERLEALEKALKTRNARVK